MESQLLNELNEFISTATDKQKEEIMNTLSNKNVHNRNMDKIEKFAEKIIKKENIL